VRRRRCSAVFRSRCGRGKAHRSVASPWHNPTPTSASTTFALVVSNQAFKLDAASNSKVAEALKSRADRAKDPAKPAETAVMAKATGTKNSDDTLKLDTIDIQ